MNILKRDSHNLKYNYQKNYRIYRILYLIFPMKNKKQWDDFPWDSDINILVSSFTPMKPRTWTYYVY